MTAALVAPAQARGAFQLIFDRTFGALFWGKMFAVVAVYTHGIVAAIVMYDATRSALMVGLVGVVQFGPQLLFAPTSGKWADRGNPVRQILIGRVVCVAGSGSTAAWLYFTPTLDSTSAAVPVLAGSLLVGFGFVVGGPAMQSIVPNLIRPGELSTAMALNSFPMTVGRVIGPATGAFLAVHLGAATGFAVCAALHLVFVAFIAVAHFPAAPKRLSDGDFRVRAAVRYVLHDRPLLLALVAVTTVGIASDPSITLTPSMADELGGGAQLRPVRVLRYRRRRRYDRAGAAARQSGLRVGVVDRSRRPRRRVGHPRGCADIDHCDRRIRVGRAGLWVGDDRPVHRCPGTRTRRAPRPDHGVVAGRIRRFPTPGRGDPRRNGRRRRRARGLRRRRRAQCGRCSAVPSVASDRSSSGRVA